MHAHSPKNGHASQRQRNVLHVLKGAGMPVLFCSKHAKLNLDSHEQCKDICTASGSVDDLGRNPGHRQTSELTYFRALQNSYKGSKTGFCEWQR